MAQFYELASLDEVWQVYPNVQVENADSVQYMVQDDKIIQYTDPAQNQKGLSTLDHQNVQFSHGSASGQQGVFLIETVEAPTLDSTMSATGPEQPKVIVQPINPSFQAPQQILTTQQPLILQSGTESLPSGVDNKSQCAMQMEKTNKPVQVIGQPAQYVIAHSNSLQAHFITTQQSQQEQRQDAKSGAVQSDAVMQKNQQSFVVPSMDSSPQKTVPELGKQTRQLIVQSGDSGGKPNSYVITQQLTSANQMQNQIVVNQLKGNKIIQNVDVNQIRDSVKIQNVDGSHFITQQLEMSNKSQMQQQQIQQSSTHQQQQFQTQHFIVPQGDRLQPKIVVQRVEMPKQITSQPQLIVQQIQMSPAGQGTQLVVRQLDPSQDRSSLPYVVTTPSNQSTDASRVCESQAFKIKDKVDGGGENVTTPGNTSKEAIAGVNKQQEKLQNTSQSVEQLQSRMNQQIQTVNSNGGLAPLPNEQQLRLVQQTQQQQHQIGAQQILQGFPQQTVQLSQFYNKDGRLIQGFPVQNVSTLDPSKSGEDAVGTRQQIILQTQHDQKPPPSQQEQQQKTTEVFMQGDKTQQVSSLSQSPAPVANLSQYRRVSLKQSEGEVYPAGVYIIPKGNNQMYLSQYQPGQAVAPVDVDGSKAQQSNDEAGGQQETMDTSKASIGQSKRLLANVQSSETSRATAVIAVDKSTETTGESAQIQVNLPPQQQQTETQTETSLKRNVVAPSSSTSTAVTSLPQYRRVSLKQNEGELCPGSVYIIPKGSNQMYISQYQPGLRLQDSHIVAQVEVDGKKVQQTSGTVTQRVQTSTQSVMLQQKADNSQKSGMGVSQTKRVTAKIQSVGSRTTGSMTSNKSAETTTEFTQIQVNLPSQQQQTETQTETSVKNNVVPPSSSTSTTVTSLPQYRRVSLKQSEGELCPGSVYIIPKGSNQMYVSQYQPGLRLQDSQVIAHVDADKVQQSVEISTQSTVKQQEVVSDSEIPAMGTDQVKRAGTKVQSIAGNHTTVAVGVNKSADTTSECDQIQVSVPSKQQRISLKPNEGDLYPANVYVIPKGSNQMYITQCQPGIRLQESQTTTQVDGDGNRLQSTSGAVTQTVEISTQSDVQHQEANESQKSTAGVSQGKRVATKVQMPAGNQVVAAVTTVDNSAENTSEFVQCGQVQINLQSSPPQQQQHTVSPQNQVGIVKTGVGRGVRSGVNIPVQRGMVFRMVQYAPMPRGVQGQGTTARLPQLAEPIKKEDAKPGTPSGLISCGQETQGEEPTGPVIYQLANANVGISPSGANVDSGDETRKFIIAPNGERKLIRVPASQQNVNINQLLQQVRFSLGSPISIVDQVVEKTATGQIVIKSIALENQDAQTVQHDSNSQTQIIGVQTQNVITPTGNVQGARSARGVSPRMITTSTGGIRSVRMQIGTTPRLASPRIINNRMVTPPQHLQTQSVLTQTGGTAAGTIPVHGAREMPKFIPGQVAICPFCGISSVDFNRCVRCRRKLPPNVKSQSLLNAKKKKLEKSPSDESGDATKLELGNRGGNEESPKASVDSRNKSSLLSLAVGDKKKPKQVRRKKISDEPAEILILSSDEEEEAAPKKVDVGRELTTIVKEPIYGTMTLSQEEIEDASKGINIVDDLMENVQPGSYTTLQCRLLRIGSYKTQTKERVLISSKGVKLVIQSLKSEPVTVVIPIAEILKILIHYGKQIPLVFIYATPKMGFQIRSQLGMESNKTGPYYDPAAQQEETHKRITLLLEKMTEDNKIALRNMFSQEKLVDELSEEEANEILVRASSCEEQMAAAQAAAAATVGSGGGLARPMDAVRKIMVYPPPPEKGGITLNNQDYACLGEDQFLNDVIIDFYLKYLLLKVLSPEDRERTHIFSTFFYKRLTTKPKTFRKNDPENDPKLSAAEKRHLRVKGWTKKVNLFEKDFIIVPINEHSHWFLAIICFPGLTGPVKFSDNTPVEMDEVKPKKNTQTLQIGNTTITHIIKTERPTVNVELDPGSDRDEAEADQDDLHPSSDDEESEQAEEEGGTTTESTENSSNQVEIPLISTSQPKEAKPKSPVKKKPLKEPIKQPCILIFDSLAGASRVRVVATLRDYLKIEYKTKMGQEREFTKDTIKGAVLKVPQQNNFTDCGLYVLQYVESFFQDPLNDFKLPLKYLQDWFPEEVVACKRQELASLIRTLMEEQGIKVEEMGLPNLTFANGSNTGEEQAKIEEDEEEDEEDEDEEIEQGTAVAISSDGIPTMYYFRKVEEEEEEDMDLDEEDMDLGEDEEEQEEEEEDEIYEELELAELQEGRVRLASSQSSDVDMEGVQSKPGILIPVNALESDEEGYQADEKMKTIYEKFEKGVAKRVVCIRKPQTVEVAGGGKSVPLTEFQDFESQITCTTIEKSVDPSGVLTERVVTSEVDEDEEKVDEDGVGGVGSLERRAIELREKIAKEKKALDVTNVLTKLVRDKGITVKRKEDDGSLPECGTGGAVRLSVNCDNADASEAKMVNKQQCVKRSSEALKSVRIRKKGERTMYLTKRQKIDET